MTTLAEDYSPPSPWMSFDIRMRNQAQYQRHQSTVAGLEDAELYWVARVVEAEIIRREQAEVVRRQREET